MLGSQKQHKLQRKHRGGALYLYRSDLQDQEPLDCTLVPARPTMVVNGQEVGDTCEYMVHTQRELSQSDVPLAGTPTSTLLQPKRSRSVVSPRLMYSASCYQRVMDVSNLNACTTCMLHAASHMTPMCVTSPLFPCVHPQRRWSKSIQCRHQMCARSSSSW